MGAYDNLEEWMAKNMGPSVGAPSSTYRDTVRSELAALIAAVEGGPVSLTERDSDPDDPTEGQSVIWQSDGTGTGNDGDVLLKVTAGGVTYALAIVKTIRATGVAATDTAALQSAVSATPDDPVRAVRLIGEFAINDTITCSARTVLIGDPVASITYSGTTTTDPIIYMSGYYSCIKNVHLWCYNKCAGLHMDDVHHGTICENVRIVWPRQIGLHLHDCWYGSTRNVEISGARGVALLDDTGNSSTHINMKLVNCWGFWSNATTDCWWDPTETENIAIWTYANTHTDAETQSEYSDYTSDWPSTDVVAAVDRGCIVLKTLQNQCQFDNLSFEPCNYGEYPLIRTRATTTAFRTVRVESGYPNQSSALFVMHEAATTKFENVLVIPTVATGYVIKLSSATSFTTVDTIDCRDSKVLLGVVDASSGSHPHLTVTNCTGTTNGTALVPWCVPLTAITAHKSQNAAPTEIADGNTAITAANLENYILYMASSTGGRAPTVPTGTAMNGILRIGETIEWVFINTGDQVVTITAATGHTLVGDMTLAASESGRFLTRVSAANTAITYRL